MTHQKRIGTFLNELWNVKSEELDNLHQLFNPNLVAYSSLGRRLGVEALKTVNVAWGKAFPDMELMSIDTKVFGSMVVAEWRSRATHQQDFNGFKPTGKQVDYRGVTSFQFDQDRVVYYQCTIDMEHVYDQLGVNFVLEKYPNQRRLQYDIELMQSTLQDLLPSSLPLSNRELICLSMFVNGWSAKQIAQGFGTSYRTVQIQVGRAMEKLGCHSRLETVDLLQSRELMPIVYDYFQLYTQSYLSQEWSAP